MNRKQVQLSLKAFEKLLHDYRTIVESKAINQSYHNCDIKYRQKWQKEYEESEKVLEHALMLLYQSALTN